MPLPVSAQHEARGSGRHAAERARHNQSPALPRMWFSCCVAAPCCCCAWQQMPQRVTGPPSPWYTRQPPPRVSYAFGVLSRVSRPPSMPSTCCPLCAFRQCRYARQRRQRACRRQRARYGRAPRVPARAALARAKRARHAACGAPSRVAAPFVVLKCSAASLLIVQWIDKCATLYSDMFLGMSLRGRRRCRCEVRRTGVRRKVEAKFSRR